MDNLFPDLADPDFPDAAVPARGPPDAESQLRDVMRADDAGGQIEPPPRKTPRPWVSFKWNDDRISAIKELLALGRSCGQIAENLSTRYRHAISRNAVIGAIHRWVTNANSIRPARKPSEKPNAVRRRVRLEQAVKPVRWVPAPPLVRRDPWLVPLSAKLLLDLAQGDCRWPVGEAEGLAQLFCSAHAHPEMPYCADHCAVAYNAGTPIAREAAILKQRHRLRSMAANIAAREGDAA